MIWYLIFCSSIYSSGDRSPVCTAPVVMPSKKACHFVGKEMIATAGRKGYYKCVGVQKGL